MNILIAMVIPAIIHQRFIILTSLKNELFTAYIGHHVHVSSKMVAYKFKGNNILSLILSSTLKRRTATR